MADTSSSPPTGILDTLRIRSFVLFVLTLVVLMGGSTKHEAARGAARKGFSVVFAATSATHALQQLSTSAYADSALGKTVEHGLMNDGKTGTAPEEPLGRDPKAPRTAGAEAHKTHTETNTGNPQAPRQVPDLFMDLAGVLKKKAKNSTSYETTKALYKDPDVQRLVATIQEAMLKEDQKSPTELTEASKQHEIGEEDVSLDVQENEDPSESHCVYAQVNNDEYPYLIENSSDPNYYPQNRHLKSRLPPACTMYFDSPTCCTGYQADLLRKRTEVIQETFGNPALTGCQACADNLSRFWCIITCSPRQSDILKDARFVKNDPHFDNNPNVVYGTLLGLKTYLCRMWNSCKKTGIVGLLSLPSSEALYKLQLQTKGPTYGVYFKLKYDGAAENASEARLEAPLQACNNYYANLSLQSKGNTSCPCESCSDSCTSTVESYSVKVLFGFDLWPVVGFYIFLLVSTILYVGKEGFLKRCSFFSNFSGSTFSSHRGSI